MADQWVVYGSGSASPPDFNDALNTTTRRHHQKSRRGCKTCKQRRIKCDETHPACRQCLDYNRHCSFLDEPQLAPSSSSEPSFQDLVDQVWTKLQSRSDFNATPDVALRRPFVQMTLEHFINCKEDWLAGRPFQDLIQRHGIRIGLQSNYVLYAILAVSAFHLHYKEPRLTDLLLVGHYHYALSLELYQRKLRDIHAEDLDPIYACGMLQVIMTIRCTLLDNTSGPDLLNGFEILLAAIKTMNSFPALHSPFRDQPHVANSVFSDLFERCNFPAQINLTDESVAPLPSTIAPLEGLIRYVTGDGIFEKVYLEPFTYLVRISKQESRPENLDIDVAFSSQLKNGYLEALEGRESIAILLLCYWFALLTRINQWWIRDPARTFCERFYVYLLGALPVPLQERTTLLSPAAYAIGWGPTQ